MRSNIQYELLDYEQLISSINSIFGDYSDRNESLSFEDRVALEVDRIKQRLIAEVFSFQDERHLERYIQYHQQALIRLMDETLSRSRRATDEARDLYAASYNGLDQLLSFVERYFAKYFDQDAKAPSAYTTIVQNDIGLHFQDIAQKLFELNAEESLTESVLHALKKVAENDGNREISYRKVVYAKEVQKELAALLKRAQRNRDINEELRGVVYYLNYNSVRSFSYHTHYIDILLRETESREQMIERLSFVLKKINQAQVKPGVAYNTQAPALKDQLNGYIIEEIEHLQRLTRLGNATQSKMPDTQHNTKVHVEMSVAQIAFFVRLLVESRIVNNENVTELLRFLANITVSKRKDTISFDSLRAKYYSIEQSTKDAVRSMLGKMISSIDRIGIM